MSGDMVTRAEMLGKLAAKDEEIEHLQEAIIETATATGYAYYTRAVEAEARAAAMRDVLEKAQWIYDYDLHDFYCPVCENDRASGHMWDCIIGMALTTTPPRAGEEEPPADTGSVEEACDA